MVPGRLRYWRQRPKSDALTNAPRTAPECAASARIAAVKPAHVLGSGASSDVARTSKRSSRAAVKVSAARRATLPGLQPGFTDPRQKTRGSRAGHAGIASRHAAHRFSHSPTCAKYGFGTRTPRAAKPACLAIARHGAGSFSHLWPVAPASHAATTSGSGAREDRQERREQVVRLVLLRVAVVVEHVEGVLEDDERVRARREDGGDAGRRARRARRPRRARGNAPVQFSFDLLPRLRRGEGRAVERRELGLGRPGARAVREKKHKEAAGHSTAFGYHSLRYLLVRYW